MRSDALKKGPARAPARAMLKGAGYSDADLEKPLVGVANTWTEVTPVQRAPPGARREGQGRASARPAGRRSSSTRSRSPTASRWAPRGCAPRSCRARSSPTRSSSSSSATCSTASSRSRGCDKTIPGDRDGARAARRARRSCSTAARSRPGASQGRDVTIQDVFEAVGAHAAGKMTERDAARRSRTSACPGAGACGGQFTANTMATALDVPRHLADGRERGPRDRSRARPTSRAACGGARHGALVERRPASAAASSRAPRFENAIASVAATRRLDERRPPPPRDRARGRRPARASTTSIPISRADAGRRRPQAGRALHRGRHVPRGRRAPARAAPASTPASLQRRADVHGPHALRGGATRPRDAGPAGRPPRRGARSSRAAASRSCAARSRPRAASSSSPGTSATAPRGPRARLRRRRGRVRRRAGRRDPAPGDVVVIRYEGPRGGPGMREMLARDGGARRPRARRLGGARHRRPLQRRDATA